MIVHLYRYPHPFIRDKWLYVGQGTKRDKDHRSGRSSFGFRFRKLFPNIPLPSPVKWQEAVENQFDANRAETVAMFHYHTWRGYIGGMNLSLPGSRDYEKMAQYNGHLQGCRNAENGHMAKIQRIGCGIGNQAQPLEAKKLGGKTQGIQNVKSGHINRMHCLAASSRLTEPLGFRAGILRAALCQRWNINRGKPCACGKHSDRLEEL
jgi:hypothetical protein